MSEKAHDCGSLRSLRRLLLAGAVLQDEMRLLRCRTTVSISLRIVAAAAERCMVGCLVILIGQGVLHATQKLADAECGAGSVLEIDPPRMKTSVYEYRTSQSLHKLRGAVLICAFTLLVLTLGSGTSSTES